MRALDTKLDGPLLLEPRVHGDDRGFFQETYRRSELAELGIEHDFVQDNHSRSRRGVLRGIHFAVGEGQAKLVHCVRGRIFDVVVDLRPGSRAFGAWESHELSDENHHQLYVPVGFGHGFCVLSEVADVTYKLSTPYDPEFERGIAFDDPEVGVEWPIEEPELSERDRTAPRLADVRDELVFSPAA